MLLHCDAELPPGTSNYPPGTAPSCVPAKGNYISRHSQLELPKAAGLVDTHTKLVTFSEPFYYLEKSNVSVTSLLHYSNIHRCSYHRPRTYLPKQYFVNLTETNTRTFNVLVEPYQVLPQGIRTRASYKINIISGLYSNWRFLQRYLELGPIFQKQFILKTCCL